MKTTPMDETDGQGEPAPTETEDTKKGGGAEKSEPGQNNLSAPAPEVYKLTQEQLDALITKRINEVTQEANDYYAAQMVQVREQAEAEAQQKAEAFLQEQLAQLEDAEAKAEAEIEETRREPETTVAPHGMGSVVALRPAISVPLQLSDKFLREYTTTKAYDRVVRVRLPGYGSKVVYPSGSGLVIPADTVIDTEELYTFARTNGWPKHKITLVMFWLENPGDGTHSQICQCTVDAHVDSNEFDDRIGSLMATLENVAESADAEPVTTGDDGESVPMWRWVLGKIFEHSGKIKELWDKYGDVVLAYLQAGLEYMFKGFSSALVSEQRRQGTVPQVSTQPAHHTMPQTAPQTVPQTAPVTAPA